MKTRLIAGVTVACVLLAAAGCGSKQAPTGPTESGVLTIGASVSLTGATAKEGGYTKEGYEVCQKVINDKGGIVAGNKAYKLDIKYQDDTSKADVSAQLVDKYNDDGIKLILGPYGSGPTEAVAAVIEQNGQVMADSAGADDKIFAKGFKRSFAVLSTPSTNWPPPSRRRSRSSRPTTASPRPRRRPAWRRRRNSASRSSPRSSCRTRPPTCPPR
jgi:branched-chain amino acid transport system substrate-binding protein